MAARQAAQIIGSYCTNADGVTEILKNVEKILGLQFKTDIVGNELECPR